MLNLRTMAVLALALSMILIGINSQSGWLFWLAGLCIAAVAVSWVDSLAEVRKLAVERTVKGEAVEGETVEVTLRVHNRGRLSRNLLLLVDEDPAHEDKRGSFRPRHIYSGLRWPPERLPREKVAQAGHTCGRALLLLPRVEAGETASLSYRRGGLHRGVYRDWPVYVYSEGILGLARHQVRLTVASHLTVLPYHAELHHLPLLEALPRATWSMASLSSRGSGMDFYGVREFQAGDPLRHVHWKSTARRGELVVREFEEEACIPLLILMDNREIAGLSLQEGTLLDIQARLAASMVHYARLYGHPVTLAAYEGREPIHYEVQGTHAALHWLASLEPSGEAGPDEQVQGLRFLLAGNVLLCHLVVADGADWARAAPALPPACRLALILVRPTSGGVGGASADGNGEREALVRGLLLDPPPGLVGFAVYREGDDLAQCLENSLLA